MSEPTPSAPFPVHFFCIGGDKCGSTWLSEMLRQHPELNVAENKEPHFFTEKWNWHRGWDWYARNWSREDGHRGEFSTSYLHCRFALERIAQFYPDAKILILLRHPLQRSVSQFKHVLREPAHAELARSGTAEQYAQFLVDQRMIIRCSKFAWWFDRMREIFRPEQVRVLFFEQIRDDPEALLRDTFAFLGVDASFQPERPDAVHNRGFVPKNYALESLRERTFSWLQRKELYGAIHWIKRTGLPRLLRRVNAAATDGDRIRAAILPSVPEFVEDLTVLRSSPFIPEPAYLDRWLEDLEATRAEQPASGT